MYYVSPASIEVARDSGKDSFPDVRSCSARHRLFTLSLLLCAILCCVMLVNDVYGEGSRSPYPSTYPVGGYRANLDFQPGQFYVGKVHRRGFLYVYAEAGEYILVGSRNRSGADNVNGLIRIYTPQSFGTPGDETIPVAPGFICDNTSQNGPNYSGPTRGIIANRAQELAGPNSANNSVTVANGFAPCAYQAPVTGIYGVLFSAAGSGGGPNGVIDPPELSNNSVSAWDVTVRSDADSIVDINSRLFTYAFVGFTGGNNRPVYSTLYYVTNDGYRYAQDLRGIDPNGYALYANTFGFLDNGQPLFKDLRGNEALVTTLPPGVTTQTAQFPIFFSDVSPTGAHAAQINRVLGALSIPQAPPTPALTDVSFSGHIGGSRTTPGVGGTFRFTTTDTITYLITISRDGVDYNPENVNNRVLTGIAATGTHTITWDGKDNSGANFPSSSTPYPFRVVGNNGNVHFPIIDAENNPGGGPTITRLNGADPGNRTVYFDDRGYRTSSGSLVGNLNGTLCPTGTPAAPSPPVSLLGVDSSTNYRLWQAGGNANSDCAFTAGWGDAKGLNLWTYYSTPREHDDLIIDPIIVDVTTSVSAPNTAAAGSTVQGTFSFGNNGNSSALGVTYSMTMTAGLGTVTFTNLPGGVTASYDNGTGFVTLIGFPVTLDPGQIFSGMTFRYTAPAAGPITVNTGIATSSPEETYILNNTAAASTGVGDTDVYTSVSVPAHAYAGATVSGNMLFGNNGINAASGVTYSATIGSSGNFPASVTFTSLPTGVSASYNNVNGQVTFFGMPGSLASGLYLSIGFRYTAPGSGSVPVNTSITTTALDANLQNNFATGETFIVPPDLTVTKSHTGNFVRGQVGATYSITVTNSGSGPKSAGNTVTVTESAPSGLTVTGMSGTGWTCSVLPTCTRTDVLETGDSYPPITVTVNVSASAPPNVTNVASVSLTGQTESNTGNNTATDPTQITAPNLYDPPNVTKTIDTSGFPVLRYTAVVINSGDGAAFGAVFTDQVPSLTTYVPGSITINGTPVSDAYPDADGGYDAANNRIVVNMGTILPGASVTMTFDVRVPTGFSGRVSNQGVVNGDNFSPVLTDDPRTPAERYPTVWTRSSAAVAVPTMTEWGMIIFIIVAGMWSVYCLRRKKKA